MNNALQLSQYYRRLRGEEFLYPLITEEFLGKIAVVSSFGTESAVLLRMVATVDPDTPVLFINTGKLFRETLAYCDTLSHYLGLTNVQMIGPSQDAIIANDPDSSLWSTDDRACCGFRKVTPLREALGPYDAWITGRKRYQGGMRSDLQPIEESDGRIKINPLAEMTFEQIEREFSIYDLPRHPLEQGGYPSVGCTTCTQRIDPTDTEDRRAGRTELDEKKECGIHNGLHRRP